ncbi:DUF4340 domain-containing protein [Roseomonas sp. BN140053]|uniref:DUF4340 domain-containing protein n=1 Tax=Roseomonas sp. BN140053 TaxID=3391898 RepID=UPI0039E8534C
MNRRTLVGLGGAAVAAVGAAVLLTPREAATPLPSAAQLAFPGLAQRLGSAARVEVRRADATLALVRQSGDVWTLPDKANYPARGERVRELLVGLTELRLTEPRTANPELLQRLGLEDPAQPGATSALLRVLDSGGAPILELVTGRRRVRTQGNLPESIYVRRPAESQAWLAEGRLNIDADPQLWIDRDVANLPRDRVQRVEVSRDGATLALARAGDADAPLRLVTPADAPPTDDVALDEIGRALEVLTFTDVRREADLGGEAVGESRFTLTDNLSVTARVTRDNEAIWLRLAAAGDDEAARLNARWRGWAYQVGAWKEKAFAPRLEDLRRQEPRDPGAAPAAP